MKNLVKNYVGNPSWQRLGQAKQEFRWRKNQHFMADELVTPLLRNLNKKMAITSMLAPTMVALSQTPII